MDRKLIIGLVLALIVIVLAVFTFTSLNNGNEQLNLNISGNQTGELNNGTLFSQGQSDNVNSDNSQSNDNANANANSQSNSNGDSGNELKKQMFTVSENETGQNEGMEPGTYVMYYTENDGPIKVDKVG